MQAVLIAVVVAGYALFTYVSDRGQAEEAARSQARAVARAVADSPSVREAIRTPKPTVELQPYALRVMADTGVDFVTIMSPQGIRWTHPDKDQIGRHFLGNTERALKGHTFTETYTGTLGASVRAVTPIKDEDGKVIGLVSAGIQVAKISERVQGQLTALLAVAGGALALGAIGTYVVNARLRRHTHGMNAAELSRMHDYHQAALHAVREGLLMLDGQYRVALINDGGRELLGVSPQDEVIGRSVADLGLPAPLTGALLSSEPRVDEVHLTSTRVLVVNTSPVSGGEQRGTVVTLRDVTELQSLMGELDSERGFTQALRSQAHEAANRLHTVVSLIELGRAEQAVDFATAELELAQALTDQVVAAVGEPVLAALLLGKTAQANERGVELVVSEDSRLDDGLLPESLPARDLVTILGNLIDNAVDAAQGSARARVTVTAYTAGTAGTPGTADTADTAGRGLVLRVADTGAGVDPAHAEAVFQRGFSTKPAGPGGRGLGLALVRQTVNRCKGTLTVAEAEGGGAEFEVRLPLGDQEIRVPAGDQGVRLPAGGQEEPLPAGGQEEPLPAGGQEEPLPAGGQEEPLPAGDQEVLLPAGGQEFPAGRQEEPLPAGGQDERLPARNQEIPLPARGQEEPLTARDRAEGSGGTTGFRGPGGAGGPTAAESATVSEGSASPAGSTTTADATAPEGPASPAGSSATGSLALPQGSTGPTGSTAHAGTPEASSADPGSSTTTDGTTVPERPPNRKSSATPKNATPPDGPPTPLGPPVPDGAKVPGGDV
ncbi:two-component sensor kinase [Streptomyces sviceus ATCC 29083]|uniref:histidine kinase n=1 Tax=Streptomyces sviceus (strain ATCC 29083 / DSM 924 / JCM 4929 / NBRC 13980 / NCIMB 11184 / NRRL 5439 / UC 5370) TaxID=463191 RepID=B5HMI8_STRX2|nr:two-component sensor kinase [Streptomyces sviceus ATCC 29083]